ncbi:hypothetical protein K2173_014609 [Erythroxylum novogranatense]|uniref:Hflx-type G domain-containing protein n=1 Tax=Erythroxylum novogranatense TaxID=1862640 RepID=A0AAV8TF22_9ROSI|nr:hypothetical protein K2173_014609 [Erythroxylum novogranatense]
MLGLSFFPRLKSIAKTLTFLNQSQASLYGFLTPCPFSFLSSPFSSKQQKTDDGDDANDVVSLFDRDPNGAPRLFVVQPRLRPDSLLQIKLNEALSLANSLEEQRDGYFETEFSEKNLPHHIVVQNPILRSSRARADTFFGPGTVDAIRCHISVLETEEQEGVDAVFVNAILNGIQQRNLERAWSKPVLDRVGLIIEIFNAHAHTKEAKVQAELAALMYKKSRLVRVRGPKGRNTFGATGLGEAEVVSARGRASGGRGFISGAGETELQLQRRRISERRNRLLTQIEEFRRTRTLQRFARERLGGVDGQSLATIAVVGYTNAGKSTLVSILSESNLYADSRLFATLDPRLKSVVLPSGRKVLFSDTVGFISDLPIQLVEAFHATLEEVVEADLLLHVIDCTAPNVDDHRATVFQVLKQIGVSEEKLQNMIEVWNKIDCEEKRRDADDCVTDIKASGFSVDEDNDMAAELSVEAEEEKLSGLSIAKEVDFEGPIGNEESDYSNGELSSGHEKEILGDPWLNNRAYQQSEDSELLEMEKVSQSQTQSGPDVKISAVTGVGLQELLKLIDERLSIRDEKSKVQDVVESDLFGRKWRPPRIDDTNKSAEQ